MVLYMAVARTVMYVTVPRFESLREMFMDRVAASKIYCGKDYTTSKPLEYYNRKKDYYAIHDETRALLELLLKMLAKKGENYTFAFIRKKVLKDGYSVLKRGRTPYI